MIIEMSLNNRRLKIEYNKQLIKQMPKVVFDKRRFQQVLLNILSNATKHQSQDLIQLKVSLLNDVASENSSSSQIIEVSVQDQGIGMTQEELESIFTPFSVKNHKPGVPSNGLGLSICQKICKHLSGDISVKSEPGQGSLFVFSMACEFIDM